MGYSSDGEGRCSSYRLLLCLLWTAVLLALPIWQSFDHPGWDLAVYRSAIESLKVGHDPYADAISIQVGAHMAGGVQGGIDPPYSYVYPPATLFLLRLIGRASRNLSDAIYWFLYAAAVLGQLWVCLQMAELTERRWLLFIVPLAVFFPGLLANGILLSGNIAYILYAATLLTAYLGWQGKGWLWFYGAVLIAAFFKAPMLTMVVIAPLTQRKNWIPAAFTATLGVFAFGIQAILLPRLFQHYLDAVTLQFRYNRDFGCSPSGILSGVFYDHGLSYTAGGVIFYIAYVFPTLLLLIGLSHRYFRGRFSLRQWLPVVFVGVLLLNPRLIEYDVAPLTLPLTLILGRTAWLESKRFLAVWLLGGVLFALNVIALYSWSIRKILDCALLVALFAAGAWRLWGRDEARSAEEINAIMPDGVCAIAQA